MTEEDMTHAFATSVSGLPDGSPVFPYLEWSYDGTVTAYLSEQESYTTSAATLYRWIAEQIKTIEGTTNDESSS